MPSATYGLIRRAMLAEKRLSCVYDGHRRELCPVVLGLTDGEEKVLAYQVGGTSRTRLPPGGQWKCLSIAKVRDAALAEGPWREGKKHRQTQRCVQQVDVDINIHVRQRR